MSEGYDQFSDDGYEDSDDGYELQERDDGALEGADGRYYPEEHFEELKSRLDNLDSNTFDELAYEALVEEMDQEEADSERLFTVIDDGLAEIEREMGYQFPDEYADQIGQLAVQMSAGGKPNVKAAYESLHGKIPDFSNRSERVDEMARRIDLRNSE